MADYRAVALSIMVFLGVAGAQESTTQVNIKAPTSKSGGKDFNQVRVTVNGMVRTVPPGQETQFVLPASEGDQVHVDLKTLKKGVFSDEEIQHWEGATRLNGSGHVEYFTLSHGVGRFGQWPSIIFEATGAVLDVIMDGQTLGTIGTAGVTQIKRGIPPDQNHTLKWRAGTTDVCNKDVLLTVNVQRTYVCDSKTRLVAEQ